ncbi:hypothetical protein, conserved [Eimeria maxima]|uniref:50S ribosomal protein L21 n=1 Tax=Eimeria maxima TaxID=5804 RepID=U6M4X8_EIMMA|nr:hypothetical protein, conserved [Eimeria maxima]CDJ58113.1 hypothetical protein, conserved [Eimeria maxima]
MFIVRRAAEVCGGPPGLLRTRLSLAVTLQRPHQQQQQQQQQQQPNARHTFPPSVLLPSTWGYSQNFVYECSPFRRSGPNSLFGACRPLTFHPQRRVVGHRLEIMAGKHRKRRLLPPKVPLHPSAAAAATAAQRAAPGITTPAAPQQDMTLFEAYRDLQLRWKRTTRQSRKKFCIARKWRQHLACHPKPEPSWLLFLHPQMGSPTGRAEVHESPPQHYKVGRRRAASPQQQSCDGNTHELQPYELVSVPHRQQRHMQQEQHQQQQQLQDLRQHHGEQGEQQREQQQVQQEVTVGDLVQTEKLHRKQAEKPKSVERGAGDKVVFGTVLLAGTREWTLLGKPTVPFARVKGVIEQQTLAGETLSFRYKKTRRSSRFLRQAESIRHWVTLVRIEEIEVDVAMKDDPPPEPPKRLLDLWANRWLYPEEMEGIKTDADGKPLVEGGCPTPRQRIGNDEFQLV